MNLSPASLAGPSGLQHMAVRQHHARRSFVETVQSIAGLDELAALELADLYLHHRLVTFCPTSGQFQVQHRRVLDRDFILEAAAGRLLPKLRNQPQGEC